MLFYPTLGVASQCMSFESVVPLKVVTILKLYALKMAGDVCVFSFAHQITIDVSTFACCYEFRFVVYLFVYDILC